MEFTNMGFFGNVWIRQQYYKKAGEDHLGHKHRHDHISLLVRGGLRVEVEGKEPFEVWADKNTLSPTFFEVPAEHRHKLIPLVDDTVAYCIFAIHDEDGNQIDDPDKADMNAFLRKRE